LKDKHSNGVIILLGARDKVLKRVFAGGS